MNIKVCGITQFKQLQQLDALNIDYAGFIFYKESPRYVVGKISMDDMQAADFDIKRVGVFVNSNYAEILQTVKNYHLNVVQLHGDESPTLCARIASNDIEVIKAFRISNNVSNIDDLLTEYDEACDYFLFDTSTKDGKIGGTGEQFDWNILKEAKIEKPFFLSGGIGLDDIPKLKNFQHIDFYGIDVNSKFEKEPGVKDMSLVLQMIKNLKEKSNLNTI